VDLGKVTEVTLPDGIPSSSLMAGAVGVGISAINNGGNESELAKTTVHFDFRAPQAPRNLTVEDV